MLDEFLESSLEPFKTLETIIFSSNKDKRETTQSQNQSQRDCRCNLKSGVLDSQQNPLRFYMKLHIMSLLVNPTIQNQLNNRTMTDKGLNFL